MTWEPAAWKPAMAQRMDASMSRSGPVGLARLDSLELVPAAEPWNALAAEAGLRCRKSLLTRWSEDNAGADYSPGR